MLLKLEKEGDLNSYSARVFRRRFRMPYQLFRRFFAGIKEANIFAKARHSRIDVEFEVLICLRILGRNCCADNINELCDIVEHCIQYFKFELKLIYLTLLSTVYNIFREFVLRCNSKLFSKYVKVPVGAKLLLSM
jgi:hypothetical protein